MEFNQYGLKEFIFRVGSRGMCRVRATDELKAKTSLLFCLYLHKVEKYVLGMSKEKKTQYLLHKYGSNVRLLGVEDSPSRAYPDDIRLATD